MAHVRFQFCCWLRHWSGGLEGIEVEAVTLRGSLQELAAHIPRLPPGFISPEGRLTRHWSAFLEGDTDGNPCSDSAIFHETAIVHLLPNPIALPTNDRRRLLRRRI
jgi:hypothetical protein